MSTGLIDRCLMSVAAALAIVIALIFGRDVMDGE